jgi:hypothetical protein
MLPIVCVGDSGWTVVQQFLTALGGGALLVGGLSAFLGKLWASRILEGERQRHALEAKNLEHKSEEILAKLEATLGWIEHVNQATFDHEFDVYRKAWAAAVDLRMTSIGLRPAFDSIDPKESEEDRKRRRLEAYSTAAKEMWNVFERNRPFYPEEIYKELSALASRARTEAIGYKLGNSQAQWQTYWEESQQAAKDIVSLTDNVCSALRKRLDALAAVPRRTKL